MDEIACSGPLTQRFARFSVAFELMPRSRATEGEGDRRALGRGQRPEYRVVPVQPPNPPNKYTNDRRSYYWAGLFARLGELLRSRLHHRIPCAGASHRIRLEMVIGKAVSDISLFGIQQFQEIIPMRELAGKFADLPSVEHRGICELQVLVRFVMNKSYLISASSRRRDYLGWLREALKNGARAAHAFTTVDQRASGPPEAVLEGDRAISEPLELVESRVRFWGGYWGTRAPGGHDSWVRPLRDKVSAQNIDSINDNGGPIELEQVRAAIKSSPKRAGVGSDLWRVRQCGNLSLKKGSKF